jgi:hypothetical protein
MSDERRVSGPASHASPKPEYRAGAPRPTPASAEALASALNTRRQRRAARRGAQEAVVTDAFDGHDVYLSERYAATRAPAADARRHREDLTNVRLRRLRWMVRLEVGDRVVDMMLRLSPLAAAVAAWAHYLS